MGNPGDGSAVKLLCVVPALNGEATAMTQGGGMRSILLFSAKHPCGNRCLLAVLGGGGGGIYRGYCVNTDPTHWLANWDAFIIYFQVRGRERTGDYDQVTLTMSTQAECGLSQTLIVGLLSDRSWAARKAMTHSLRISAAKRIQKIKQASRQCVFVIRLK